MSETAIVNSIKRRLLRMGNGKVIKFGCGMAVGEPDLMGCWYGIPFAFEVKRPGKHATRIQEYRLDEWRRAGAVAQVITSADEMEEALRKEFVRRSMK